MNNEKHILIDAVCEDIEGSPFNGMNAILSRRQIELLNDDAEQSGLTRRWFTVEEFEKRKELQ